MCCLNVKRLLNTVCQEGSEVRDERGRQNCVKSHTGNGISFRLFQDLGNFNAFYRVQLKLYVIIRYSEDDVWH